MIFKILRQINFLIIMSCQYQIGRWVIAHWKHLAKVHPMHIKVANIEHELTKKFAFEGLYFQKTQNYIYTYKF